MRIFFYKLKTALAVGVAVTVALAVLFCFRTASVCRLAEFSGARTFYLCSSSAWALQKSTLSVSDCFAVRGESVRFARPNGGADEIAQDIANRYGATVVAKENACGTVSYYAYIPNGWASVCVNGAQVNLHIAVGETQCAVGTPIIFGGF